MSAKRVERREPAGHATERDEWPEDVFPSRMRERPSPNFDERPPGVRPDLIVVHGTAGASDEGDLAWLTGPASRVSYHYLIGRDGLIHRLVPPQKRAWHAGRSSWEGRPDVNDYSIGIGLGNRGPGEPYEPEQYVSLAALCADLRLAYRIPFSRIVGHCHVSPGRKRDPWLHFVWGRLFHLLAGARVCGGGAGGRSA